MGNVAVEEHNILGGLGGAVCEVVAGLGKGKVMRLGIRDRFSGIGSAATLIAEEGLTEDFIKRSVCQLLGIR